jgi:hypothetical protein
MNLFISDKHIFGLDNLYIGELGPEAKVVSGLELPT